MSPLTPMPPVERAARALGPILDEFTLEQALTTALARRLGPWLDETNNQGGGNQRVERPRSWTSDDELSLYADDQLPRVIVVVAGTSGRPVRRGSGLWQATYSVGLGAIVAHQNHRGARRKAAVYGAALRTLALHHIARECPQIASIEWVGSGTGAVPDLDRDKARQLAVADQAFEVTVVDIADDRGAVLTAPDPDENPEPYDPGNGRIVETTSLTVERRA